MTELINFSRASDFSDLELFRVLGGADDGIIDLEEFRTSLVSNPKLYVFGSKLTQLEVRNLFTRMTCSEFDHEISYSKYKNLIYEIQFDVKQHKNKFVTKLGNM